ncbi:hypothetical protein SAMN05192529_10831 [Arachidicoccus rhizosphaerae]|uniref:Elongation factor Tu n=1 Tax=Arachidicoccus rhizosphaerae TaxID=551991 RepID=A0A1H3YEC6_9BACT|nr:hypothetical protein [Arachidicoccus rhizosphaerae]SEA09896.1 hypothetical protein SAMN05192529_10831 [Arachidicoccus rhizosphaerae]
MECTSVLADVKLFNKSGGESAPVYTRQKTTFKLEHQETLVSGEIILPAGLEKLEPGEQKVLTVHFDAAQLNVQLARGIRFSIHMDDSTIGVGNILEVTG